MSKFRVQFSDEVKERTIESPKGDYKVCLEGYFDFNEALMKLMISQGGMLPVSSQYEPQSESDDESDMDFSEPQFDDVCDAIQVSNDIADKFAYYEKAKVDAEASARQKFTNSSDLVENEVDQKDE